MASEITGWWGWGTAVGTRIGGPAGSSYTGGMLASTPSASPALLGVGYIIGPSLASVVFAGGVLGWWCLVPVMMFVNRDLLATVSARYGVDPETGRQLQVNTSRRRVRRRFAYETPFGVSGYPRPIKCALEETPEEKLWRDLHSRQHRS